jgi:hypothetical protein
MKRLVIALFGVLIVMLCIMPAMAEDYLVPDERSRIPEGGMDTQSPVLDGSAFTQYDTVFFHGTMAENQQGSSGVYQEYDLAHCHEIVLLPGASSAIVNCPYFSYDSKQGGIQPRVRYAGLQYRTNGTAEIYRVGVFNGGEWVNDIEFNPPLKSTTGWSLRVIDLGAWYRFDRGLNMCVVIRNPAIASGKVDIGGYGARFEW